MSSGRNWIPIRGDIGKVRYRLAEKLCQLTGWLVTAEDLQRTNPTNQHFEDCCAWDCWAVIPGKSFKAHIYSWDTMTACVRHGVVKVSDNPSDPYDIEVCSAE